MPSDPDRAPAVEAQWISRILGAGLVLSSVLMFTALIAAFAAGTVDAERVGPKQLASADPPATVAAIAVIALACTPAARVLGLAVLWTRERDWRFVAVALAVVTVLVTAAALGHG